MGDGTRLESGRAMSLESSTLSPSALRALGRAAEVPAFQAGEVGSIPTGHSVDRVGSSAAEQVPVKHLVVGSIPTGGANHTVRLQQSSAELDSCG